MVGMQCSLWPHWSNACAKTSHATRAPNSSWCSTSSRAAQHTAAELDVKIARVSMSPVRWPTSVGPVATPTDTHVALIQGRGQGRQGGAV